MSTIVIYNPSDGSIPGRVTDIHYSVNTPDFDAEVNKLVNPNLDSLSSVEQKYWKRSGSAVIEMAQNEKDIVDTEEASILSLRSVFKTTTPSAIDDINAGYEKGSTWINTTTNYKFYLADNTSGSAKWIKIATGGEYFYTEDNSPSSTNSKEFQQRQRLSMAGIPSGDYRVNWNYSWRQEKKSSLFYARVQVDDTDTIHDEVNSIPTEDHSDQLSLIVSGNKKVFLSSGDHDIDLDFKTSKSRSSSHILYSRIEIWRVG